MSTYPYDGLACQRAAEIAVIYRVAADVTFLISADADADADYEIDIRADADADADL